MKEKRPSWNKTWMDIAYIMSQRSTCVHWKVGAIVTTGDKYRQLVAGYNGSPRGEPHCIEVGCQKEVNGIFLPANSGKCCGCHAEQNAITHAALLGIPIGESVIYCTYSPCFACAKQLLNLRIREFVFGEKYEDDFEKVEALFAKHGIFLTQYLKEEE